MKVSFSTLGCPRWDFQDIVSTAKDLHMDGVEIRGIGDTMFAPNIGVFQPETIDATRETFASRGLCIPILTSGAVLAIADKTEEALDEAKQYIDLAHALGVPYIRVMGTGEPQITPGNFALAAESYRMLCAYGEPLGVRPLIETNGKLYQADAMLQFLSDTNHPNSGVLWDLHHTVRFANEDPQSTLTALGAHIYHVHVKDSAMVAGNIEYRMMGYGDIPVPQAVKLLQKMGYEGFISLEWVKRWNPDLQEPGIVFAHFKGYMDELLRE